MKEEVIDENKDRLSQIKELLFGDQVRENKQALATLEQQLSAVQNQSLQKQDVLKAQLETQQEQLETQQQQLNQLKQSLSNQIERNFSTLQQNKVSHVELADLFEKMAKKLRNIS